MKSVDVKTVTRAALIASLYATLTLMLGDLSFGPVQFRISEAMTVLPYAMPSSIPGLFIGCLIANILGGYGILDVVFGSAATLIAAVLTAKCRHRWLAPAPPVVLNALIIGTMLYFLYYRATPEIPFWLPIAQVAGGQFVVCYGFGLPLLSLVERHANRAGAVQTGEDKTDWGLHR